MRPARIFVRHCVCALTLLPAAHALADDYPSRPITLIVPYPPVAASTPSRA